MAGGFPGRRSLATFASGGQGPLRVVQPMAMMKKMMIIMIISQARKAYWVEGSLHSF